MPSLPHVFLRESILKALAPAGQGMDEATLLRTVEERLHPLVFPQGSEGRIPGVLAELAASGLVLRAEGAYRLAPEDAARAARDAALGEWFEPLGGVTHVHGDLFRCPLPWSRGHFAALREAGVRVVYSFEEAVPGALAEAEGLSWRPFFWVDNGRPSPEEMDAFLADALALPAGTRAAVHCKAGLGRTGMALACVLAARNGWGADEALGAYWARVPLARAIMETYGQADFVREYLARPPPSALAALMSPRRSL